MKKFLSRGFPYHRGRRTRISENIRELTSETSLNSKNLIMPYFVREESDDSNILSMKGIKRLSSKELLGRISKDIKNGINTFALFPKIPDSKKSSLADESLNEENLVCRIIKTVKKEFPNVLLICDVALDAYTVNGHDGVVNSDGDRYIFRDKWIDRLTLLTERLDVVQRLLRLNKKWPACLALHKSPTIRFTAWLTINHHID